MNTVNINNKIQLRKLRKKRTLKWDTKVREFKHHLRYVPTILLLEKWYLKFIYPPKEVADEIDTNIEARKVLAHDNHKNNTKTTKEIPLSRLQIW